MSTLLPFSPSEIDPAPLPDARSMRICTVILVAVQSPQHADFDGAGKKVNCCVWFPAAADEDENLSRISEILEQAKLRLHHLERYSLSDQTNGPTGWPEIDGPMENVRRTGRHLVVSRSALKLPSFGRR
jgi:hypothetical protein